MKKLLCLVLALTLTMSIVAGCGKKDENSTTPTTTTNIEENAEEPSLTEENSEDIAVETEQASKPEKKPSKKNNTVTSDKNSTAEETDDTGLYVIKSGGTNEEQISYHFKSCPVLEGKEYEKIAWNAVQIIGLRHCSKCNPPKYEGYVE